MDILTIITVIGGIILTVGYIPQLVKLYETGNTEGINNGFWYLITSAVTITAVNLMVDSASLVLIIIQVVNATLAGVVLLAVHVYRKQYNQMAIPIVLIAVIVVASGVLLPIEITQSLASGFIILAYVSQLITLIKAPSVVGVSPSLYLLIAIGLGIMATKMFITEVSIYIITTEIVNITLLLICSIISFLSQKKRSIIYE